MNHGWTQETLASVDRAFRQGALELRAPPTRFYVNLTERCSLRCLHCITHAPQRTVDGTARDMDPAVVEALRPSLRHAAYVGFPHAGEPLVSAALEPVLQALQQERHGQPTVVHLLTNGVALTADRFRLLARLGVNSISVSMDGMSAATQDALRVGSHSHHLLPALKALAAVRGREFPQVRMGVAWTLTASNLGEVPELLNYCADIGLDWVKLEEMYPINDVAAQLADIPLFVLVHVLAQARQLAGDRGLPLLEHVFDQPVWKCQLQPGSVMERFSRLDDFVNRMEINPCRLPYELVCVEPNGDVKPVSFEHAVAGNLLEQPLDRIWNSESFVRDRRRTLAMRRCPDGVIRCAPDSGPTRW